MTSSPRSCEKEPHRCDREASRIGRSVYIPPPGVPVQGEAQGLDGDQAMGGRLSGAPYFAVLPSQRTKRAALPKKSVR